MQEKVTLKVGDILERKGYRAGKNHIITSFSENKINTANGSYWIYPLLDEKYYVNGKLYARENIIVPDFKEEEKVEYQEITPENFKEVYHNTPKPHNWSPESITLSSTVGWGYSNGKDGVDSISTPDFYEFLAFVQKRITLKLLPKANPFDVVKVDQWVRSLITKGDYRKENKWYQRSSNRVLFCFYTQKGNNTECSSDNPEEWDLTDIRDYNPTECMLKIGDKIITKSGYGHEVHSFGYSNEILYLCNGAFSINFKNINKVIESVNGKKYDKVTIPKFDFAQCLVDAGFTLDGDGDLYAIGSSWNESIICLEKKDDRQWFLNCSSNLTEATPANAKIIIEMDKLAKGIK